MVETKTNPLPLPLPKFGGKAAGAKPVLPTVPLIKAEKRFLPKPIKRRHAFNKATTAFSNKSLIAYPKGG
jgi:hypothetical protein